MAPPTNFGVVAEREVYVVREVTPGVIPAGIGVPVPITAFKPSDKPLLLDDDSWQGSMGDTFAQIQGPLIASEDIGGNIYGDTFPHFLYNILGDYTAIGTAASPASTSSTPIAAGATSITVASGGASFTTGMQLWIEDGGSPAANEIVTVTSGSTSTNIPLSTPTRFAHLTATPFTNTTGPYTHTFALLNGSVGAANGPAQGPTHCITDRQGLTANGAAQYAYGCLSELTITGNSEQLLKWTGKLTSQTRLAAVSPVGTTSVSNTQAYASWRSVVGIGGPAAGGTQVKDTGEWSVSIGRALKVYNTNQGSQLPYIIARGKNPVTGQHLITPAIDESALIALLANTQPQLQYLASNGLSGTNLVSVQIDVLLGSYQTADIEDSSELFGYTVPWKGIHTAASSGGITTTGASGGKGAVKVTVINNTPTY